MIKNLIYSYSGTKDLLSYEYFYRLEILFFFRFQEAPQHFLADKTFPDTLKSCMLELDYQEIIFDFTGPSDVKLIPLSIYVLTQQSKRVKLVQPVTKIDGVI